jgi:hypothetical protein
MNIQFQKQKIMQTNSFIKEIEQQTALAKKKATEYLVAVLNRLPTDKEVRQQMLCDMYKVKVVHGKVVR